jgi:hypothetical protein
LRKLLTLASLGVTGFLLTGQKTQLLPTVRAQNVEGQTEFTANTSDWLVEIQQGGTGVALSSSAIGGIAGWFYQSQGTPGGDPPLSVISNNGQYLLATFANGSVIGSEDKTAIIRLQTGDTTPVPWNVGVGGANNGLGLTAGQFYLENPTYTVRFLIDNNGNVGIGTKSPGEVLHVASLLGDDLRGEQRVDCEIRAAEDARLAGARLARRDLGRLRRRPGDAGPVLR